MTQARTEVSEPNQERQTLFECDFCASRQPKSSVSYNWYGYPICPVCNYQHGPRPLFKRTSAHSPHQ
jgi:hypothetical protein